MQNTVYFELTQRENSNLLFNRLFGVPQEVIDSQIVVCKAWVKEMRNKRGFFNLPCRLEDCVLEINHYMHKYDSVREEQDIFKIPASSFARIEASLLTPLTTKWASKLIINLDHFDLQVFGQAQEKEEFVNVVALWDSTPIQIPRKMLPYDSLVKYLHPYYKTLSAHRPMNMPCFRYGVAIVPSGLSRMKLTERSNLLRRDSFSEWKQGLPIDIELNEFDPHQWEGFCLAFSHGFPGATSDKAIFEDTNIGSYITRGLRLCSDLGLQGQEQLLGTKRDRGNLVMRAKKPRNAEFDEATLRRNSRVSSFRHPVENWNRDVKRDNQMLQECFRGHNLELLDYYFRFAVGLQNARLLVRNHLFDKVKWEIEPDVAPDIEIEQQQSTPAERVNLMIARDRIAEI